MHATHLYEALDFTWNHGDDTLYYLQNKHLSAREKIHKRVVDCIVYLFALILGVDTFEKLSSKRVSVETTEYYRKYVNENSYTSLRHESVILILNGEDDLPASPENFKKLAEQSNCKIKFVKIHDLKAIEEGLESLKKNNNAIKALWIRAHGTPVSISFAIGAEIKIAPVTPYDQPIDEQQVKNTRTFLEKQLNQLEPDAPIILESCSTGQEREAKKENIAQFIASAAGGRVVYAPSHDALAIDKNISYIDQGFKVTVKGFQPSTYFANGSCLARICAIWHAFCNHEVDITREFRR